MTIRAALCSLMMLLVAQSPTSTLATQSVDRSQPPAVADAAGGFTLRRLSAPIAIDGRDWIEVQPIYGSRTVRSRNGAFTLTLEESKEHTGDLVRSRLYIAEGKSPRVRLDTTASAFAYITPDSRWIIFEPLEVFDVRNWRRLALSKTLKIEPYVVLKAISSDGRRLFLSRQPCPFDCQHLPNEYYELAFP